MEIKILGMGCKSCRKTYDLIIKYVADNHLDATVEKIEDMAKIAVYNVMQMPAIVVDGKVKLAGKVPNEKDLAQVFA